MLRSERGSFLAISLAVVAAPVLGIDAVNAWAQTRGPDRPVELVVGAGPGGGNDNIARTVQRILQQNKIIDVPITVVNKPGGGGAIAIAYIQQNAAKGNFIAIGSNTLLTNHITRKNAVNPGELTPLAILINEYISFNVRGGSPIKDARDLISRLKQDPGSLVLGISSALGNINHIAFATVAREAGIDPLKVKTVVFNSSGASLTALMGGHIDLVVGPVSIAARRTEGGEIRALAFTAPTRRSGALASIPTWKEVGIDAVVDNWRGIVGPGGMPAQEVAYWDRAFGRLFEHEEWKTTLEQNHWDNAALTSRESEKYLARTYADLKRALGALGMVK
jgi:putative tricarboxylic transport membrane protein